MSASGFHGLSPPTKQKKGRWASVCPNCVWIISLRVCCSVWEKPFYKPEPVDLDFRTGRHRIHVVLSPTAAPKKSSHWSPVTQVAVAMTETFGAPPMSLATV